MSAAVGADIESLCRKCGDVWHVVVAKEDETIVKVQCKQCQGYHKHRPPGQTTTAKSTRTSTRTAASKSKKQTVSARIDEPQVAANEKPTRVYKFSDSYEPGDRIEHPQFGFGIVEISIEPGKMQVFFPSGRRVLALAKPEQSATLTRPPKPSNGTREPPKW